MKNQLPLLTPAPRSGHLDRRTRETGRKGVAQARAVLRRVAPPEDVRRGAGAAAAAVAAAAPADRAA